MSKADKLLALGEVISFGEGDDKVEFKIMPLMNSEVIEIMKLAEDKQKDEMIYKMVYYSLIKDDATITMDDVKKLPFLFDFVRVISKVSHLEDIFDFQKKNNLNPIQNSSPTTSTQNTSQAMGLDSKQVHRVILS